MANKIVLLIVLAHASLTNACTNFMVSPGATTDGSTIMGYSCDGPPFAALSHYPAQPPHSKRQLKRKGCAEEGPSRGEIEEEKATYNTVGLTNEHAVSVGETTFGGIDFLRGTGNLTYYDVMELALQSSTTARELITKIDQLISIYGYGGTPNVTEGGGWGTGESFTVADTKEVWHMELIGMGNWSKGAVWIAKRVPDGFVGGHANQARITTFPRNDPDNCMFSNNVVSFAVTAGLYPATAPVEDFSFADAYDPISFSGARFCDARVWSFFSQVAEPGFEERYVSYVTGKNLSHRMPLFVKASKKVSVTEFFGYMRNHYEHTALSDQDISSGPLHTEFRVSPSHWMSHNQTYVNERHVGVPYTSTTYVAQLRGWLPAPIGALNWFSVDDSTFSVHAPFHAGSTRVPVSYTNAAGSADRFSFDSAFWVFNMVANFAYYRWDQVAPVVSETIRQYEQKFVQEVAANDAAALDLWNSNHTAAAIELLTAAGEKRGNDLVSEWLQLYQELFMKFRDGSTPRNEVHGVEVTAGYAQDWYDRVAKDTGDRYLMPESENNELNARKLEVLRKNRL
jgi:dipeptidase